MRLNDFDPNDPLGLSTLLPALTSGAVGAGAGVEPKPKKKKSVFDGPRRRLAEAEASAAPDRGDFLGSTTPKPGSASTFAALFDVPPIEEAPSILGSSVPRSGNLALEAATGMPGELGSQMDSTVRQATKEVVDNDLANAMAGFDREYPGTDEETRNRVKYRIQGMLDQANPRVGGETAVRFRQEVARGADGWETFKKYGKDYARDLFELKGGQVLLKKTRAINQKVTEFATDAAYRSTIPGFDLLSPENQKRIKDSLNPVVRPVVGTVVGVANPGMYLEQVLTNSYDKTAVDQMISSFTDLVDPKAGTEQRVQSAINWVLGIVGVASAPMIGGNHRKVVDHGMTEAAKVLADAPETPEVIRARQEVDNWSKYRESGLPDLPEQGPIPSSIGTPATTRKPFREDVAVQRFEEKLKASGKVDDVQARAVAATMRERAKAHEVATGESVQSFWENLVPEIRTMSEADWRQQEKPGALLQERAPDYFKSERALAKLPSKGTPDQMRKTLLGDGVKPAELVELGIEDLFDGKDSVTKAEIQAAIDANRRNLEVDSQVVPDPRYEEFTVPGGSNYRTMFLNLSKGRDGGDYVTSHYPEKSNIVAHVRMKDRVNADGKAVLHIEELQSDWHQQGRDKGYREPGDLQGAQDLLDKYSGGKDWITNADYEKFTPQEKAVWDRSLGVEPGPFDKTWHEMAIRKIMRYAAENGYREVVWNTGETVTNRFNLGTELKSLKFDPETRTITGIGRDGTTALNESGVTPERMAELVGKSAAERLNKSGRVTTLEGDGLKTIQGGMAKFYDDIVPRYIKKLTKNEVRSTQIDGHTMHAVDVPAEMVQPQAVFQGNQAETGAKGVVEFANDKAIITLFETADVTTIMHELAHTWRRQLVGQDLQTIKDWLKVDGDRWTVPQEERFARAIERYLMTGKTPNSRLQWAFEKFKEWFRQVYHSVKVSKQVDVKMPREVRETFDRMFDAESASGPRLADREAARARMEELAAINPEDPRIDVFADEFDQSLASEIQDVLGGEYGDRKTAAQILEDVQMRQAMEDEQNFQNLADREEALAEIRTMKKMASGSMIRWTYNAARGGWQPDYRQTMKVGVVSGNDLPAHVARMIEDFRDHVYLDPDYRLVPEGVSRQWSPGTSKAPEGALTVRELAEQGGTEIDVNSASKLNQYPIPLLNAFEEYLQSGKGSKTIEQIVGDIQSEDALRWAPDDIGMLSQADRNDRIRADVGEYRALENAANTLDMQQRMAELEAAAAKEKYQRDVMDREAARSQRIEKGEESFFEKRARLAAERLAAAKGIERGEALPDPQQIESYAKETDTLFQDDAGVSGSEAIPNFDDLRDVAAGLLDSGITDQRAFDSIRYQYKLTPSQAKEVMRGARKLIRMAKAEGEIPKAAPRIVELHDQGMNFEDISRVLAEEFPDLTKGRYKRAWTQALENAGRSIETRKEKRYTYVRSQIDSATARIQEMHEAGEPFYRISEMMTEEYPGIPKAYHEEAFARAMANKDDWVVTKIDEKGHIKVFMGGKSITVPLATVADVEQWAKTKGTFMLTESRLVDKLSNRNEDLRKWLVENREQAVTAMVRERGDWRQQLLNDKAISWLGKDKKASALVQKYGEGIIGLDDLQEMRPNDWEKIVAADEWFRTRYETMLDRVNDTLTKLGQKPIPYRRNYYTHFQEQGNIWARLNPFDERSGGAISEMFGSPSSRPSQGSRNSPYNPFAQRRLKKEATIYDALGAFEAYLDPTLAQIHLTKPAMRRRVMARVLEEKGKQLRDQSTESTDFTAAADAADQMSKVLKEKANELVGQKSSIDRTIDDFVAGIPLGTPLQKSMQWMARRAAASKIVGSLRTAIMQTSGLATAVPELGLSNLMIAAAENAKQFGSNIASKGHKNRFGGLKIDPILAKSDFLARRYTETDAVRSSVIRQAMDVANYPMEFIEQNVAETIWRAAFDRASTAPDTAIGQFRGGLGLSDEAAIAYADRITERILAGRARGERPIAFDNQVGKILFQFQLETNNFLQYLGDDFRKDNGRALSSGELAWKGAKLTASLYVLNTIYEELLGASPLPDLVRTAEDELELIGAEIDPLEKIQRMAGRLGGEALSAVPGGSTLSSMIPEYDVAGTGISRKEILGDTEAGTFAGAPAAFNTFSDLIADPMMVGVRDFMLPGGGTQLQRTIRGIDAIYEGALSKPVSQQRSWFEKQVFELVKSGTWKTDPITVDPDRSAKTYGEMMRNRRKFKIETTEDKIRALLFGPNATKAADEYFDKEKKKTLFPSAAPTRARLKMPG